MGQARLEVYRSTGSPAADLAFEEELLERVADGSPALLLTSWNGPVVVLGFSQPVADVDLRACRRRGIPVLRRSSGGTGVVHRQDWSAGLVLPRSHRWCTGGVIALYESFLGVLGPLLERFGATVRREPAPRRAARVRSPICFEDRLADTLLVGGRKAVGSAQVWRRRACLVHATVLLGLDAALYAELFRVQEERIREALAPALAEVDPEELSGAAATAFAEALDAAPTPLEPRVSGRFLDRFRDPRWAPLPESCVVQRGA
mgnify:CR=1 FL=1